MEVGEAGFSHQLPEFFLFTSVLVLKAAGRPEGSPTTCCLAFCSATRNGLHPNHLLSTQRGDALPSRPPFQENFPALPCLTPPPPGVSPAPGTSSTALVLHNVASSYV